MDVSVRGTGAYALLVLLFALAAPPAAAQQTTGKIQGRFVDGQTGQPLAGAQVTIVGTALGNVTNDEGYYFINNVPAGEWDIQARYIGYQTVTVQRQRVLAGQAMTVDFSMTPEAIALEPITVEGERNPLVPRDQVLTKAFVTGEAVRAIPVESVRDVVALMPGVVDPAVLTDGASRVRGVVIRGGRPGEAAVYVDGVLVRNFSGGAQSLIEVSTNAVEEVDVLLGGFGAEYGQAKSGVINVVTRGGGAEFSGAVTFETDRIEVENSYGYSRLEATVSGPIAGEKLGFSLSGTAIGMEDADPAFLGSDVGVITFRDLDTGEPFQIPAAQSRFFKPTGTFTDLRSGNDAATGAECAQAGALCITNFEEIGGLGAKMPWNNGDEYNLNLTFRGVVGTTRYNLGWTASRQQQRFFDALGGEGESQFRPHALQGQRFKSWLLRGGLEQVIFLTAESGATLRVNVGFGRDEYVTGPLGGTLGDSLRIISGDLYPEDGDILGFTFGDFKFPFEEGFTVDRWMERFRQVQQDPALGFLIPFETLINPATGQPWTPEEAIALFDPRFGPDNAFGLQDFLGTGLGRYGFREEKTFSIRAELDWQVNRHNRLAIGGEFYKKDIGNLASTAGSLLTGVRLTSPTFQNVYEASPIIAGFYAKERLDIGDVVVEVGGRLDMFDSDALYPVVPGFVLPVTDPQTGERIEPEFVEQETQWQFSPRLGVGFPVTVNTQFRFSYGHFTQVPPLNVLFDGITQDLNKTNPNNRFGRPIEFGRMIGYELGFTHAFDPQTVLDVSGYTREKQGDIAYRTGVFDVGLQTNTTIRFLTNADFGYVRGLDTRLSRRFGQSVGVNLAYSYLVSRSTGSDPNTYLVTLGRQTDPVTGQEVPPPQAAVPADFDQTHTISAAAVLRAPEDIFQETRWANALLRRMTFDAAFSARSGLPYTRTNIEGATSDIFGPDPRFIEPQNASRLPWTYNVNVRVGRTFPVGGNELLAYVDVRNLFNTKNVDRLFSSTQDPLNPGENFLDNNTLGAPRVFPEDIVIADLPEGTDSELLLKGLLARRERFFGNDDGIFTRREQYESSIQSFLASGWGNQVGIYPGEFFGQPRQIRFGVEWRF